MSSIVVAPSILACDWGHFHEEIRTVTEAGADWIHIDVMDGHFVPPITFGPGVVKAAKAATNIFLDVHLMIEKPERQIDSFVEAGANNITVHQEACKNLSDVIQQIKNSGVQAGVTIKPNTPVSAIEGIIPEVDLVLIMSVEPGWGGQSFIPESLEKMKTVQSIIDSTGHNIRLEVDGGINAATAAECIAAGADTLVAGSYIFGSSDYKERIEALKP